MSNLQSYFIAGPENLLPNHIYKSEKPNNALVRIVSELAENGLDVFQLRAKSMKDNEIIYLIKDLSAATFNTKMKLCINDNVNVASKCKGLIDILHLGQTDMDPNEAKKLIDQNILIGLSITNENQLDNIPNCVNYLGVGPIYSTGSKSDASKPIVEALPGFKPSKPVVFCGLFPVDSSEYQKLKDGLAKLQLNDASFSFEAESSSALGLGFRCGFLGLLHLEIITERLEREFDVNLLTTTPGVVYKINLNNGDLVNLQNPSSLPDPTHIKYIEEPWIKATVITPDEYLGSIIKLCQDKRGIQTNLSYSGNRAVLNYEIPLNEVVFDFNDRLKSMTSGYASFDYEILGHREGDLVKLSILVNAEPVDALAMMVHKEFAQSIGREVCEKLKDLIPRHNFMIPLQAAIGGKIIARETIKGFKKDVLTKIHGGGALDRKRKLLEKQKKGKARAKQFGRVEIPQEAFIGVLKINKD